MPLRVAARFTTATDYYYNDGDWNKDEWRWWNYAEERRTDVDLGLDGIVDRE